jgi:hypothetical protein
MPAPDHELREVERDLADVAAQRGEHLVPDEPKGRMLHPDVDGRAHQAGEDMRSALAFSAGVATYVDGMNAEELAMLADSALYAVIPRQGPSRSVLIGWACAPALDLHLRGLRERGPYAVLS